MKKALILFGLVAACFMSCQPTPNIALNTTSKRLLGTLEVTFGAENGRVRANFTPSRITSQIVFNNELIFTGGTYSTATETATNRKFLNAQFTMRNLFGGTIGDVTLVSYRKTGNAGNTALKNVTDFGGIINNSANVSTSSNLRPAVNTNTYAQTVRPSHTMSGNGTVALVAGQDDLRLFSEYDLESLTTTAGTALASGEYLLPYGFGVRNLAAPTNPTQQRLIAADTNADTGTVTISMRVDGSNEPSLANAYRFTYTALVFDNPTFEFRYAGSLDEKASTDIENRRNSNEEVTTIYSSAQNTASDYALHALGDYANACQVRIAGSAAAPEAFLESIAPTSVVGRIDPCFSSGGFRVIRPGGTTSIQDIAQFSDGRIASVGQVAPSSTGGWLGVYYPNGDHIRAVFSNGTSATNTYYTSVGVDSLNRMVRGGHITTATGTQLIMGRSVVGSNITNDTAFSSNQTVNTTIHSATGSEHVMTDLVVQPNNQIVAVGYVKNGTSGDKNVFVMRYTTTGSLDTSFNGTGIRIDDVDGTNSDNEASSVMLDASGNIIVVGKHGTTGAFLIMRFTSSGARDTSFNTVGHVIQSIPGSSGDAASSVALQNQKIIVVGTATTTAPVLAMIRLNSDGTLDTTFGSSGTVIAASAFAQALRAKKVLVQSDDKIIVTGAEENTGGASQVFAFRYLLNGAADTTFNPDTSPSNPIASNRRFYNFGNSTFKTTALSALIGGTPTDGRLVIGGWLVPDSTAGSQYGLLSKIKLGAN